MESNIFVFENYSGSPSVKREEIYRSTHSSRSSSFSSTSRSLISTSSSISLTTSTTSSSSTTAEEDAVASPILKIPIEIFIEICGNLEPNELISLNQVCKMYNNILNNFNSKIIQNIWRKSRISTFPCRQAPPPRGINEKQYILFLMIKRCNFCKINKKSIITSWDFLVKSCKRCIPEFREYANLNCEKIPYAVREGSISRWQSLSFSAFGEPRSWFQSLLKESFKYMEISSEEEREKWVNEELDNVTRYTNEIKAFHEEDEREKLYIEHTKLVQTQDRTNAVIGRVKEMSEELDEEGNPKYEEERLRSCVSFRNALKYKRPFTERAWNRLKKKLIKEYGQDDEKVEILWVKDLLDSGDAFDNKMSVRNTKSARQQFRLIDFRMGNEMIIIDDNDNGDTDDGDYEIFNSHNGGDNEIFIVSDEDDVGGEDESIIDI
nr:7736_t:CDS:2 [Entrophospora candida]CAG8459581.1 54_t:CDS:2 [Entrophospora candida]